MLYACVFSVFVVCVGFMVCVMCVLFMLVCLFSVRSTFVWCACLCVLCGVICECVVVLCLLFFVVWCVRVFCVSAGC